MIEKADARRASTMSAVDDGDRAATANNYCRDFIRGFCNRENCRFVHEIPPKKNLRELFRFCHDYQNKGCFRQNCKFLHSSVEDEDNFYATGKFPRDARYTPVCNAFVHGNCSNQDCNFLHPPELAGNGSEIPLIMNAPPQNYGRPLPSRDDDSPPDAKFRRFAFEENTPESCLLHETKCANCDSANHKVKLLHDNISVLLKKVADLTEKNQQLTSMNEFLLEQTASLRSEQSCVITSRHGASAPVSLATVSVTPVVSLAGAIPGLVPAAAAPNLTLAPASSRAQILTPAPQILTVSTTQQLMGNSGTLIVTSAGAQQLMQVSDSGTLMGGHCGGQTVVAVTPAQLTLAQPAQQLMSNGAQTTVQQLVQQSALQPQLAPQHQATQYAAQQSVQHLTAQQSQHLAQQSAQHLAAQQNALAAQQNAQHLAAQQNAQHLAAQQSAQHLAAQQSAQHLAAQQNAQHLAAQQNAQHLAAQQNAQHLAAQQNAQHLAAAAQQSAQQQLAAQQSVAQQLVHQTSTQQITISSSSQPMALANSQAQPITFPMISQSILPH